MTTKQLFEQIKEKESFLCIGLDTDLMKIPKHLLDCEDPQFEFNKQIIDATNKYCVAYKPNLAFYEIYGSKGIISLEKTARYVKENYPEIFLIADAKRGDIGNTSTMYAEAYLKNLPFDAITVAPYMGEDSVSPFLQFPGKWAVILALTSNKGAQDFQWFGYESSDSKNTKPLFWKVLQKSQDWGTIENTMYVVGATKSDYLEKIRETVPNHFLLVPGVGAQGGSLEEVIEHGMNSSCGLIVNSSREIIYADATEDFATMAAAVAIDKYQQTMKVSLHKAGLI